MLETKRGKCARGICSLVESVFNDEELGKFHVSGPKTADPNICLDQVSLLLKGFQEF